MKRLAAFAIAAAAALSPAAALAQPTAVGDTYVASVPYADLNLADPDAARTLERRIEKTSRRVCGERSIFAISLWDEVDRCQAGFTASARQQAERARAGA